MLEHGSAKNLFLAPSALYRYYAPAPYHVYDWFTKKVNCTPGNKLPKLPFESYIFKQVCWDVTSLRIPLTSRPRPRLVNLC